jgi:CheY-like chemotaxis protein
MNKPLSVLQVEDSESDSALIVHLLERAGYDVCAERVETAPQMQAALEKRAWNAIVADYHLPQFDAPSALATM